MPSAAPVIVYQGRGALARLVRLLDAALSGLIALVAAAGAVTGLAGGTAPWVAVLCVPVAAFALAAAWRSLSAALRPAFVIGGVLERASVVNVSTPRVRYGMWQLVVDGRTFEFPERGHGSAGVALQPGRRVHLVGLLDGEVLSVAVDPSSKPVPAALPARVSPAPLTPDEVTLVVGWARRDLALWLGVLAVLVAAVALVAALSPVLGLVGIALLPGAMVRAYDGMRRVGWASKLEAGAGTVLVEGPPSRTVGAAPGLRIGGRRVEVAVRGPRRGLERELRGRALVCPPVFGSGGACLVVVSWEASAG